MEVQGQRQQARKIALVDDDSAFGMMMASALRNDGHRVMFFSDPLDARRAFQETLPELALLDIRMPGMDGHMLLKELHAYGDVPVIFITGIEEEPEHIKALNSGADDYLVKPITMHLLRARIDALLRRIERSAPEEKTAENAEKPWSMRRGPLAMDPDRHLASWRDHPLRLTVTEFIVLKALAERVGYVRTRGYLKTIAYGSSALVDDRTIDSHVKRIRNKLRKTDPECTAIETLYGLGYRFSMPTE